MTKTIEEYSLAEIMQKIEDILINNPEPVQGFTAIYQFDISGAEEGVYQLYFQEGKASVKEGTESTADCTLTMSLNNFRQFLLGKLNGALAYMTGKLKINGDIGKALKLENILKQYNVKDHL